MQFHSGPTLLSLALFLLPACSSDDSPSGPGGTDTTAPGQVSDLTILSYDETGIVVIWTAPGDDGAEGIATGYQIGYSATPITDETWEACTSLPDCPTPTPGGSQQDARIDTPPTPDVYVAIKAVDEAGNWSDLSNVVHGHIPADFDVIQLTHEGSNRYPSLNDGFVTWVGWRAGLGEEIFIAGLSGASASPTRLTDNGGQKQHPSSHGREMIAWMGREGDGYDWEIFTYHYQSTPRYRALTDDEIYDLYPALAGGGDVAWVHGWEIHYFDEFAHEKINLTKDCCPSDKFSSGDVAADDGTVIWSTYERGTQNPHQIYLWDGARREITSDIGTGAHDFSMNNGEIAYEWSAQPITVRYWDGVTVHDLGIGADPSLDDGWIAYEAWDGHDWEIHLWDGVNVIPITDNDYEDYDPTLSGNLLAWNGRPDGPGGVYQIFYTKLPGR
jgi:hypothetical protein